MVGYSFTIGSCPSGVLRAIGFFILASLLYNGCEYLFNIGDTDVEVRRVLCRPLYLMAERSG